MATINYNFDLNDFESKAHFKKTLKGILTLIKENPNGLVEGKTKNKPKGKML
jgi:outer membrane protein OmpA-like peptidoglycan-associated protein